MIAFRRLRRLANGKMRTSKPPGISHLYPWTFGNQGIPRKDLRAVEKDGWRGNLKNGGACGYETLIRLVCVSGIPSHNYYVWSYQ